MGQMTKDRKDDSSGQQRGEGVCEADDECILAGVVAELVVGTVGSQGSKSHTQREERLCDSCVPYLERKIMFIDLIKMDCL